MAELRTHQDIALEMLVQRVLDYAIFTLDADGIISSWNPAAERMKGYRADEAIGKHYRMLYVEEDAEARKPEQHLKEAEAMGVFVGEGRRRRKNGEIFVADVEITPLKTDTGEIFGYAKIVRDVTDRVRDRERIREANHDLDQFSSIAAHDLQEPLRTVSNYLSLLERRSGATLDQQSRGYIAHAVKGTVRMQGLISFLLQLARIGRESNPMAAVDMSSVWNEAIDNLSVRIRETSAEVTAGTLPMALGHRNHLVQLLQNLLGNALKFQVARGKPVVNLSASVQEDGTIRFSIKDNGIGMKREDLARIFEAFERLHARAEYSGTGLGLAICLKIVQRHGGRLWVESEVGRGSTFHFTLAKA